MVHDLVFRTRDEKFDSRPIGCTIQRPHQNAWVAKEAIIVTQYYFLGWKGATRPILSVSTAKETVLDMRRLLPRKFCIEIEKVKVQLPRHEIDDKYWPRNRHEKRVERSLVGADPPVVVLVAAFRCAILP